MNKAISDYLAKGGVDPSLVGRIEIKPRAWLLSDAEFRQVLDREIWGMKEDITALRIELLRKKIGSSNYQNTKRRKQQ